jgi:hypothetical protein
LETVMSWVIIIRRGPPGRIAGSRCRIGTEDVRVPGQVGLGDDPVSSVSVLAGLGSTAVVAIVAG